MLLKEGFGDATNFCSRMTFVAKVSKVVLPVFFRKLDACIVTKRGFETMSELNPQTGQQLKTLAVSPALVPFLFCFRADYTSPIRKQVVAEISKWHTTPAGRQILTIFQCDRLEEGTFACLESAQELLDTQRRLSAGTNSMLASP